MWLTCTDRLSLYTTKRNRHSSAKDRSRRYPRLIGGLHSGDLDHSFTICLTFRDDHGTSHARGSSFLMPPSTTRPYVTARERLLYRRKYPHNASRQLAFVAVEMAACKFGTGSCKSKYFSRFHWRCQIKDFRRCRLWFGQLNQTRLLGRALNHAEDHAPRDFGLSARAKQSRRTESVHNFYGQRHRRLLH